MILLASATLMSPAEIARMLFTDESHVRKVIHVVQPAGAGLAAPSLRGRATPPDHE